MPTNHCKHVDVLAIVRYHASYMIPVFDREAPSYPKFASPPVVEYGDFNDAAQHTFDWDAHFAAYSAPATPYRLAGSDALQYTPTMVLFVVDVDAPGHEFTEDWWTIEEGKLDRLISEWETPPYVYTTNGGYRIVFTLDPFPLRTPQDVADWKGSYTAWLDSLSRQYGIEGDRQCKDWTRCYRLPRVTRNGELTTPLEIGDPKNPGYWDEPIVRAPAVVTGHAPLLTSASLPTPDNQAKAAELLASVWPRAGRHVASLALCGALAHKGWDEESIVTFVTRVSALAAGDDGQPTKRRSQARDSLHKLASGEPVSGWGVLIGHIGDSPEASQARALLFGDDRALWSKALEQAKVKHAPPAPREVEIVAHLETVIRKKTNTPQANLDRKALRTVLDGTVGVWLTEEQTADAARALVRNCPTGTTDAQRARLLARHVPREEAATAAIETANAAEDEERAAPVSPEDFELDEKTMRPVATSQANIRLAWKRLGVRLSYNEFSGRKIMECAGQSTIVEDHHNNWVWLEIDKAFKFKPQDDLYRKVVDVESRTNGFHPVRDRLASIEWDGASRIDSWLSVYGGAEETIYTRAIGRMVLIAAVRRVRDPGCKFDEMLILEGAQGTLKSTALKTLALNPEWFSDDLPLDADPRRQIEALSGKWIVEAGELHGMRKGDVAALKAFLSRPVDEARLAYGHESTRRPRQCIIIGTTNDRKYLKDPTGNRRYCPVLVKSFDIEALSRDVEQLWAEACHYEALGESIRMDPSLYPIAAEEQEARRETDPYEIVLSDALCDHRGRVRSRDVFRVLGFENNTPTPEQYKRIGDSMRRNGWEKAPGALRFRNGERVQGYIRGTVAEQQQILELAPGGQGNWVITLTPVDKATHEIARA